MIRLKGKDVVDEALWTGGSPLDPRATFYLLKNGRKLQVLPELISDLIRMKGEDPESFFCEIPCVWDLLPSKGEFPSVSFFLGEEFAIVRNPYHGGELGDGMRAFAVFRTVFEKAARWAKATPILEIDDALDEFMNRLFPRIILRRSGWRSDPDLLQNAHSLSRALAHLFEIDIYEIQRRIGQSRPPLFPAIQAAVLFDLTLDRIREILSPPGSLQESDSLRQ